MDGGPKVALDTSDQGHRRRSCRRTLPASRRSGTPGFKNGKFAVLACPAWMLGYIQGQAPDTKGKWDIAAIPGGGGNWGGSFLTIPKQGKNVDAACEFIKWPIQPAQQIDHLQERRQPALAAGALQGPGDRSTSRTRSSATRRSGRSSPTTAENLTPQYLGQEERPDPRRGRERPHARSQQGKIEPATRPGPRRSRRPRRPQPPERRRSAPRSAVVHGGAGSGPDGADR